jgi:hypothetical protein
MSEKNPTPFDTLLYQRPWTLEDLNAKLAALALAVVETQKKGTLTLTIQVSPSDLNEEAVVVSDRVRLSAPDPDRQKTVLWPDGDGGLSVDQPGQGVFALGAVHRE